MTAPRPGPAGEARGTEAAGQARLVGPSLMAALMLALLAGLGVWQLHRLAWKRGLLAEIDHAEAAPAVPLPDHPGRFQKVSVSGRLRGDLSISYGAEVRDTAAGPVIGSQLIQPLFRDHFPPILVDRGWVPDHPVTKLTPPGAPVSLEGYIRAPEHPGLFSAKDDPGTRRFYTLDPAAMGAALGLAQVAPYTLVVLGPPSRTALPAPATGLPRPPNDHLQYAITWFGLAAVLAVTYLRWLLGQRRARR